MILAELNRPLLERFMEKVEKHFNGCWYWTAFRNPKGYGMFKVNGRHIGAHRISYEIFVGEIPKGLLCLHRCDNPPCVNPKHLFIGTNQDNMDDMKEKGRGHAGDKSWRSKLTWEKVRNIRRGYRGGVRMADLARENNVNPSCIEKIVNNRRWIEAV